MTLSLSAGCHLTRRLRSHRDCLNDYFITICRLSLEWKTTGLVATASMIILSLCAGLTAEGQYSLCDSLLLQVSTSFLFNHMV